MNYATPSDCLGVCSFLTRMGSLAGHVIPGAFFIFYGVLWCLNCIWYHLKTRSAMKASGEARTRTKKEKSSHSASSSFFEFKRDHDLSRKGWIPMTFTRVPIESLFKIFLPALGLMVEAFFNYRSKNGQRHLVAEVYMFRESNGELNDMGKMHHITMYGSFVLSGLIDILTLLVRLPRQTSMLFLSLAFTVEGLLFYFHTLGRDTYNIEIHTLLTYSIFACVVLSMARLFSASNVVINLALGSSILLQGTWFVQAGYILFGGFVKESSGEVDEERQHRYMMFVIACFTWHLIFIALGNVLMWIILSACLRSRILHKRNFRRRGFLASLRQGAAGSEEQNKLIVEEDNEVLENGIEMQHMVETRT